VREVRRGNRACSIFCSRRAGRRCRPSGTGWPLSPAGRRWARLICPPPSGR